MTCSFPNPKSRSGTPTPELRIPHLPRYESVRSHEDGKRLYETPEGSFYSVTTVLSGSKDMSSIESWRESIGQKEADRILRVACARGDATHLNIENWMLKGEEPKLNLLTQPYWKSIRPFLDRVEKPLLIEGCVWHPDGYAGALDCIATLKEDPNVPVLLDWKTADKPKKKDRLYDYSLQCAAYVNAANYIYKNQGLNIKRALIVIAVADDSCQIEELDKDALDQLYIHFKARLTRFTQ
jgi:hypothetical protein